MTAWRAITRRHVVVAAPGKLLRNSGMAARALQRGARQRLPKDTEFPLMDILTNTLPTMTSILSTAVRQMEVVWNSERLELETELRR